MLDFSKLKTPPRHEDVLVVPEPRLCTAAARANADALDRADLSLLDSTLADWRRRTRKALSGSEDALVIVTGHAPGFIHPGVWAKHVVAMRLAGALDGRAINLVVDSDSPEDATFSVPSVDVDGLAVRKVRFAELPVGWAYEQLGLQTREEIAGVEQAVCRAMGEQRYHPSQMARFFSAMAGAVDARDWVDQAVAGRRSIETGLGVDVDDLRIRRAWGGGGPMLSDMLINAVRFATSYNRALAEYRRENRVRGPQRPIPDLCIGSDRCEVPVWAYRANQPRRRVAVGRSGDVVRLFAEAVELGEVSVRALRSGDGWAMPTLHGWVLRPRALALTIWARLFLADLFIHGIGGAKYDRISDAIIADYYGLPPPHMACVSATLHLSLPASGVTPESFRSLRRGLRDLQWNPQRNLPGRADLEPMIARRAALVEQTVELRERRASDHQARRETFRQIREINTAMLSRGAETLAARRVELECASAALRQNRIAQGREYFFGLFDRQALERLMSALPAEAEFRV